MASAKLSTRLSAELIGTLFFVFIGAGSVVAAQYLSLPGYIAILFIAIANGLGLALGISITMGTSGGHLNPAVSVGALIAGKISARDALAYIVAQCIGATIGAMLLYGFFPSVIGNQVSWGTPSVASDVTVLQAIFIEALLTFFLMFAVFGTAIDKRAPKIAGFGIGLTVFLDAMIGGPLTGAAMNPARAIGPAIASLNFANWYVYWIGPIIGAVIAALLYSRLIMERR